MPHSTTRVVSSISRVVFSHKPRLGRIEMSSRAIGVSELDEPPTFRFAQWEFLRDQAYKLPRLI